MDRRVSWKISMPRKLTEGGCVLKICVVGNNYNEVKNFCQLKFGSRTSKFNAAAGIWTLVNGDEIHMAYGDDPQRYNSYEFDAFVVTPQYITVLDVIRARSERGKG